MYMLAVEESGEKTWNLLWIKENMNLTFKGFPDVRKINPQTLEVYVQKGDNGVL